MNPNFKPIYAIAGPTASGKSELGIELALRCNGEIINCDSVQIYREIRIATAKVTIEEMRGVPHHLLDYVSPHVNYTVADWANDAITKIHEIESRGNTPILVGGTGFYLRTLREPLFESPKTDGKMRERLTQLRLKKGAEHLHKLLQKIDKQSADRLFPRDYVRSTRALEFYFQTGEKFSEHRPNRGETPEFADRVKVFVLNPDREKLYERINQRAEKHFAGGLIEEVKFLRKQGLKEDTNALGSHGYRRVCEYLRGERTIESAIEQTKQDVRHYAKRQLTWFRHKESVIWLDGFGEEKTTQDKLLKILDNLL
jgi:tRNA dimethylallyltransferase